MNAIEYQLAVQRATQAAIWGMPAVGIWDFVVATRRDLGGDIGDVVYFSKPMESRRRTGFPPANRSSCSSAFTGRINRCLRKGGN